jgi:hypothetical protein
LYRVATVAGVNSEQISFFALTSKRIRAGIAPDIRARAPKSTKLNVISAKQVYSSVARKSSREGAPYRFLLPALNDISLEELQCQSQSRI